jgi:hypothetical protein
MLNLNNLMQNDFVADRDSLGPDANKRRPHRNAAAEGEDH